MIRRIISAIPNTITCLNLISGCLAIYMAFHFSTVFGALDGAGWAMVAIGAAAVFDFFDGASARLLKAFSPLGKDLDSLSDLVSFGVAPAMLLLNAMQTMQPDCIWPSFAALLVPAFGSLRLAKFNNDTEQATIFRGLPIPANAIFWIGFVAWMQQYQYPGFVVCWALILLLCWAMVGSFKMFSLKFKNFDFAENFVRYVIVVAAIVLVALYGVPGLAWTILLYFLLSIMRQSRI